MILCRSEDLRLNMYLLKCIYIYLYIRFNLLSSNKHSPIVDMLTQVRPHCFTVCHNKKLRDGKTAKRFCRTGCHNDMCLW